jgi:Flp pilus assembly secretin CpaC
MIQGLLLTALVLGVGAGTVASARAGGIAVGLNEVRRVPLKGSAATVMIGDTKIADVSMSDAHSLIITGRGFGTTGLMVTDDRGRTLLSGEIMVSAPDEGRVTIFHGTETVQYACGGHCQQLPKETAVADGGASLMTSGGTTSTTTTASQSPAQAPGNYAAAR